MKIRTITILLIALVLVAGAYFIYGKPPAYVRTNTLKSGPIVAFGDSLVYGYGSTTGNDFVSVLSREIGKPILNFGVSGDNTQDGLNRIGTVLAKQPSVALILFGGNDILDKIPQSQTFQNLGNMINQFQTNGVTVIVLGVQGSVFNDPYQTRFEALAKKYNVKYVPNVLSGIIGNKAVMFDAVHPNNAGYKLISDKVYPVLSGVLR